MRVIELEQRHRDLTKWQGAIEHAPLPHDFLISFECWVEYNDSGVLPFAGGWLEQPQWLLDDFHYYDVMKEYRSIPAQIGEAKRYRLRAAQ